jgi:hypothetical protein
MVIDPCDDQLPTKSIVPPTPSLHEESRLPLHELQPSTNSIVPRKPLIHEDPTIYAVFLKISIASFFRRRCREMPLLGEVTRILSICNKRMFKFTPNHAHLVTSYRLLEPRRFPIIPSESECCEPVGSDSDTEIPTIVGSMSV